MLGKYLFIAKQALIFSFLFAMTQVSTAQSVTEDCYVYGNESKSSGTGCLYHLDCYGDSDSCRECFLPITQYGKLRVPVVFTAIAQPDGTGAVADSDIAANLAFVNEVFEPAKLEFFQAQPVRKGGQFNNSNLYNFNDDGSCNGINDNIALNSLDISGVINIYVVSTFTICGTSYSGVGFYPGSSYARVVMKKDKIESYHSTLAHEIGHTFGLFHTHEGYGTSYADTPTSNACHQLGDKICDTPADPKLNLNSAGIKCSGQSVCDCNRSPSSADLACPPQTPCGYNGNPAYAPITDNLMIANPWIGCPVESLTPCQRAKVYNTLFECRSDLCSTSAAPVVLQPSPVDFGSTLPILYATTPNSAYHIGNAVNWYATATATTPLAEQTPTYTPQYGNGVGKISAPGTYEFWVADQSPYNPDCASPRTKITLIVNPSTTTSVAVKLKVLLQGCYQNASETMSTYLRNNNLLPNQHPFNTAPWWYNGSSSYNNINDMPATAVDWVLIEARSATNNQIVIERQAAILLNNGSIISPYNANQAVTFSQLASNVSYYFVVRTRNHLPIMTQQPLLVPNSTALSLWTATNVMGGATQLMLFNNGKYGLVAGDFNADGAITVADFNNYIDESAQMGDYLNSDCSLDGAVTVSDYNGYLPNSSRIGVEQVRY